MAMPTMFLAQQIHRGDRVYPEIDGTAGAPGIVTEVRHDSVAVRITLADGRILSYDYNEHVFAAAEG